MCSLYLSDFSTRQSIRNLFSTISADKKKVSVRNQATATVTENASKINHPSSTKISSEYNSISVDAIKPLLSQETRRDDEDDKNDKNEKSGCSSSTPFDSKSGPKFESWESSKSSIQVDSPKHSPNSSSNEHKSTIVPMSLRNSPKTTTMNKKRKLPQSSHSEKKAQTSIRSFFQTKEKS